MFAALDHIDQLTPHVRTYYFRTEKPYRHVAGEFTEMHLPHDGMDGRGDRRWFTISSAPTDPLIGITTRFTPGRSSSFKRALQKLQPGDEVALAESMGDFVLPKDKTIPLVFVAAGLGITPVHSIVSFLSAKRERRSIHLLRTDADAAEEIFATELQAYPLTYQQFHTSAGERMTITNILPVVQDNSLIYLSGPEGFIKSLSAGLQAKGIPVKRIITDLFPGYAH